MEILTISIQTQDLKDKIISFLKQIENQGVEIISQEDIEDFQLLALPDMSKIFLSLSI